MVEWVGLAERVMWMKLQNFFCQLITGGSRRAIVANASTSLASSCRCSVLLRKLHMQALGFYIIMLDLSFLLLQVIQTACRRFLAGRVFC